MLTAEYPSEALKSCLDRFRDAELVIPDNFTEKIAGNICAISSLQGRRDALASVHSDYREEVKALVVELFNAKRN
jgi:hypothetical protein